MKFIIVIATILVASAIAEEKTSYNGYKFYRLRCQTDEQLEALNDLENIIENSEVNNI